MKWLHRVHRHTSTRLALDLLFLVMVIIGGLLYWESTWPSKEVVRHAALTKPTTRIIRTKRVARRVAGRTLMIEKDVSYGTGTVIAREGNAHFALTNHHVIAGSYFGLYADSPYLGGRCEATVLKSDKALDLALVVFFSNRRLPVAKVAARNPAVTSTVWCVGYGGGEGEQRVTRGILSRTSFPKRGISAWMVDNSGWFGDSGGGAYNDKCELIGVPRLMRGTGFRLAPGQMGIIPLPVIQCFLVKLGFVAKVSQNPGEVHFCLGGNDGENQD